MEESRKLSGRDLIVIGRICFSFVSCIFHAIGV